MFESIQYYFLVYIKVRLIVFDGETTIPGLLFGLSSIVFLVIFDVLVHDVGVKSLVII